MTPFERMTNAAQEPNHPSQQGLVPLIHFGTFLTNDNIGDLLGWVSPDSDQPPALFEHGHRFMYGLVKQPMVSDDRGGRKKAGFSVLGCRHQGSWRDEIGIVDRTPPLPAPLAVTADGDHDSAEQVLNSMAWAIWLSMVEKVGTPDRHVTIGDIDFPVWILTLPVYRSKATFALACEHITMAQVPNFVCGLLGPMQQATVERLRGLHGREITTLLDGMRLPTVIRTGLEQQDS